MKNFMESAFINIKTKFLNAKMAKISCAFSELIFPKTFLIPTIWSLPEVSILGADQKDRGVCCPFESRIFYLPVNDPFK